MGRDTVTVGLSPPSSAGQHGAVRRVAEEQELGHNDDGDACPRPLPRPRPPRQQLRQGARPAGAGPVGKVPRVPSGCATVQEAKWGTQLQAERRGSRRVPEGKYDTSIYTQLDNICEDCYNLYKEADVHQFCRADCFSTSYFQRCLQALLLEEDRFLNMVQIIGRKR